MSTILSESEIAALLAERKPVTEKQRQILKKPKPKNGHPDLSSRVIIKGEGGGRFEIHVRRDRKNKNDFSVILVFGNSKRRHIRLIRCNGWHSPHQNTLEIRAKSGVLHVPENTFHIHQITERYQQFGRPEQYAEPTLSYASFESAVEFLCYSFGCFDPGETYRTRYPLWDGA